MHNQTLDKVKSPRMTLCIVSMLDILGTSNILCSKDNEKINEYIVNLENLYDEIFEKMDINFSTFSDNIFVHTSSCSGEQFSEFILRLASVQLIAIIEYNLLLRGGISEGGLYHPHKGAPYDFIIGDAVVLAHKLESKVALYPRIVINPEVFEKYKESFDLKFISMDGNLPFINYLAAASSEEFVDEELIQSHRDAIINHIHQNNDLKIKGEEWDRIRAKDIWVLSYHNEFCKEKELGFTIDYFEEYSKEKEKIMIVLWDDEGDWHV